MGKQSNVNLKNVINTKEKVDMNANDNNVSDHEHIFNNVSRLISISLPHISLHICTKGPKILVLSRILKISGPALVPYLVSSSAGGAEP